MPTISQEAQNLIQQYKDWYNSSQRKEGTATVHVDEVASQVAAFYEKIRGLIDWREEHLLRRGAMERILKRRLFLRIGQKIEAYSFVTELIRAGHFPNDKIEETKIDLIQATLDKYIFIVEKSPAPKNEKNRMQLQDWLSSIAACEIEEILDPPRKERILINYMAELMQERIKLKNGLSESQINTQIYIATQRALFKLDNSIIAYHLLKQKFPQWKILRESSFDKNSLEEITFNIYSIWDEIEKELRHPLSEKFYRICERYDTPYLILGDILSADPMKAEEKLNDPELVEAEIKKIYQIRLNRQKSKVSRAAFYSTVSIFLTKIFIALLIELPVDRYYNQFSLESLGLNILIPPLIMLTLILSIRPPSKQNLEKVIMETMKISYAYDEKDTYAIKSSHQNSGIKGFIFMFYALTFIAAFGVTWLLLDAVRFTIASKIIFIIFLSLISFAGTKIRERAKELSVEQERGNFITSIMDWISLPFIQLGKWMSGQWARYNTIAVFLLTLVDLPFQVFIELLEQWRVFIKEKKEEIH
jgi:hypothetical protein